MHKKVGLKVSSEKSITPKQYVCEIKTTCLLIGCVAGVCLKCLTCAFILQLL